MSNHADIITAIRTGVFSRSEIDAIEDAVRAARHDLIRSAVGPSVATGDTPGTPIGILADNMSPRYLSGRRVAIHRRVNTNTLEVSLVDISGLPRNARFDGLFRIRDHMLKGMA